MNPKQHVVPYMNGWAVRPESGQQPSEIFKTKTEAVSRAEEISKNYKSHIAEHRRDGTFEKWRKTRTCNKNGPNQHVVPDKKGSQWKVQPENGQRASAIFSDKDSAVRKAREIANNYCSELFIHRRDGTFQTISSH